MNVSESQPQLLQNLSLSKFAYHKSGTEYVAVQQPSEFYIVRVQLYGAATIDMLWSFLKYIFLCYIVDNVQINHIKVDFKNTTQPTLKHHQITDSNRKR